MRTQKGEEERLSAEAYDKAFLAFANRRQKELAEKRYEELEVPK